MRGVFAKSHLLLARAAAALPVLHAPDRLAARVHLDVEPTTVGDLVGALFRLQSLGLRVGERHACPLEIDPVPHGYLLTP